MSGSTNDECYSECLSCAHKSEEYQCPNCGLTGYEIFVKRWEHDNECSHPSQWKIPTS